MARTGGFGVVMVGAKEFVADCRVADRAVLPLITKANVTASNLIADETRERMDEQFVTDEGDRSGRLLGSVKAKGSPTEINVSVGGPNVKHAGWWEFGGDTNSPRGNTQREQVKGGRSLYPAAAAKREEIDVLMQGVMNSVVGILSRG